MVRRICVVTGSRAEYGLLYWVLRDLADDPAVELQLVVTGMHLSPEFGSTVRVIEQDGFVVSRRVEMLLSSDSPGGTVRSVGLGLIGMSDAIESLAPDILVLLGDRFEIFAAATAAMFHKVPIAHIAGGDVTEGAYDEAIRHAITKMAQVHFVTNEVSAGRVRQLGEDPERIHVVGSPGLDHLTRGSLLSRVELEEALGAKLGKRNFLITFHPVTLDQAEGEHQLEALLAALEGQPAETMFWLTLPNADTGGRRIADRLMGWAAGRPNVHVYTSLGQQRYLSLMRESDLVIGNSSSGLYEAPSFGVPTVDIGDRQAGRLAAPSVLHCAPEKGAIEDSIARALDLECGPRDNPYGDGHAAERIVCELKRVDLDDSLLKKRFHPLEAGSG